MLYGTSAYSPMPVLGNYAIRRKSENFEMKTVNGRGVKALSWLEWMGKIVEQRFDMRTILSVYSEVTLQLENGERARLDGWITMRKNEKGQNIGKSFEFHSSVVHSHPSVMTKEEFEHGLNPINGKPNKQVYEETLERDRMIAKHKLVEKHTVIWEHEWDEMIRTNTQINSFVKESKKCFRPDPVKKQMTWRELLELICEEKVHGVVKCSLEVPEDQIERFSIYPPFWLHRKMDREQ